MNEIKINSTIQSNYFLRITNFYLAIHFYFCFDGTEKINAV
jgi:hypothetical protein